MHKVKVLPGAPFEVGQGAQVELTAAQYVARRHKLEPIDHVVAQNEGRAVYRVRDNIQFKVGEEIAVSAIEKGQAHLVEALTPADPGFTTPKRSTRPARSAKEH